MADGCECNECLPQARADWREMLAGTNVKWPLGISSGTGSGGVRVKAYVAEFAVSGQRRQMFSLDTRASRKAGGSGQWEFATVTRPSGAETVFALTGAGAGEPVNVTRAYRMTADAGGCEIRFANGVVHRFDAAGALCQVRKRVGRIEVAVNGGATAWPGLTVRRSGSQVTNVTSLLIAEPAYTGNLITTVNYRKLNGELLRTLAISNAGAGSRYVRSDAQGNVLDELRTIASPGFAALWQGVATDGTNVSVALEHIRQEFFDAATRELTVRERRVLDPDGAVRSNVTETVFARVAGNWQPTRRIEGAGRPEAQTTRWQYFTNSAEAGYGRVRLQEDPDGGWTRYAYDGEGRVLTAVTPIEDAGPDAPDNACRVRRRVYAGDPELAAAGFPSGDTALPNDRRPRLEVEQALGVEVARTYRACLADRDVVQRCVAPGAACDDPANLARVTVWHTNGVFAGRPRRVEHADGTLSLYAYAHDAVSGELTVTARTGAGDAQAVTAGTETVTLHDAAERPLRTQTRDIASGALTSDMRYTRDAVGRVTCASNAVDGAYETTVHGCYGPLRVTDAEGVTVTNAYNRLRQVRLSESRGVRAEYACGIEGETERVTLSAAGEAPAETSTEYDALARPLTSRDALGRAAHFAYGVDAAGAEVETATRPDGSTESVACFRDGRMRSLSGSGVAPRCWKYGADADGVYEIEYAGADAGAAEWVKRYTDMLGRVWKTVYADGHSVTAEYDAAGRVVRQTDGITTELWAYDATGTRTVRALDMDGNGAIDAAGSDRIVETRSQYRVLDGRTVREETVLRYAAFGSAAAETTAVRGMTLDGTEAWSAAFGRTNRTFVARDRAAAARTVTTLRADGTRRVEVYTNGLLRAVTEFDAAGAVVRAAAFQYDGYGRLSAASETAADGTERVTRYGRDAGGQATNIAVTAGGQTLRAGYEFDAMGRVVRETLPDGGVVEREYDARGELIAEHGAGACPVWFGYDAQGRLAALSTFRNGREGDPDVTRWEYDARRGWLTAKVYADGSVVSYSSLPNGLPATRTDARGVETRYAYDAGGGLTGVSYSDGTPAVSYEVDRLGRAVAVHDGAGAWSNAFAADGSLRSETRPDGWTVAWHADALGRLTNLSVSHAASGFAYPAAYAYDPAGRLAGVRQDDREVVYSYGPDGVTWTSALYRAAGADVMRCDRAFDAFDRLTGICHSSPLSGFELPVSYAHDLAGRRTFCGLADGSAWSYDYDGMGQVTEVCKRDSGGVAVPGAAFEYAYDYAGNRTRATVDVATGLAGAYTVNALNQYERVASAAAGKPRGTVFCFDGAPRRETSLSAKSLTYDADGNLLSDGTFVYAWDAENRLIEASNAQLRVAMAYDHLGRLARKTVTRHPSPDTVHTFVYDGWNLVAELVHAHTHRLTNLYTWGQDLSGTLQGAGGIGGLLFVTRHPSRDTFFHTFDAGGNVIALVNAADGSLAASYEYGPFGEVISASGPLVASNPFRFSTKYTDPDTGLLYYGYRHYSPSLGRWLSRDPIGEDGGANLYGFVGNDPANGVDSFGDRPIDVIKAIASPDNWAKTIRRAWGLPFDVLSGDLLLSREVPHDFSRGGCEFLITVTGIKTKGYLSPPEENGNLQFMRWIRELPQYQSVQNVTYVDNPTFLRGAGDMFAQIPGDELKAVQIVSSRLSSVIRDAYKTAVENGCRDECIAINVVAHSQGAAICKGAFWLLRSDIRKRVSYTGLGGQKYISPQGLARARNIYNKADIVPRLPNQLMDLPWASRFAPSGSLEIFDPASLGFPEGQEDGWIRGHTLGNESKPGNSGAYLEYLRRYPFGVTQN